MGILDWFKNRSSLFDEDRRSICGTSPLEAVRRANEMTLQAIDKAVTLTNPRLKLVRSYQERLAPAVEISVRYIREIVLDVPPPIQISAGLWSSEPELRAFLRWLPIFPPLLGIQATCVL